MSEATIAQFRTAICRYLAQRRAEMRSVRSVSAGRSHPELNIGYLLFHGNLACLNDYCLGWPLYWISEGDAAIAARYVQIHDFHEARLVDGSDDTASPYRPLAPEKLFYRKLKPIKYSNRAGLVACLPLLGSV